MFGKLQEGTILANWVRMQFGQNLTRHLTKTEARLSCTTFLPHWSHLMRTAWQVGQVSTYMCMEKPLVG